MMAKIEGVSQVLAKLQALERKAKEESKVSCIVGYTQAYAIFVHEDLTAHHPVGQAKYLEAPARRFAKRITQIVQDTYKQTKSIGKSLLMGGLFLQRESQQLVPVDTSALKNSAFTRLEK